MPTRDQVLQVPFVGGIDEYTDPDQLQPPSMAALTNCVVRKTGRIEKREGFQYLQKVGVPDTPADTFAGTAISEKMEALGAYSGSDGSKLLLAADSKLYEYVGLDANHGYREVNRLPSCYGTLHPVDATGGEIIEVESMLNDAGTLRCTVWVLGVRNGQDMTNDTAISEQPPGTYGVYAAVQRVSDSSFVVAPTRLLDSNGFDTVQCCDLRMAKAHATTSGRRDWVVAFRLGYEHVEALCIDMLNGHFHPTNRLVSPPSWSNLKTHRSFDITGTPQHRRVVLAYCQSNTTTASSDVEIVSYSVNGTGTFSVSSSLSNLITSIGAIASAGGRTWSNFAARGVVFEAEPSSSANIAVSIRLLYWTSGVSPIVDSKMVLTRIGVSNNSTTCTVGLWAWLHRIGFQTNEAFTDSISAVGSRRVCDGANATFTAKQNVSPQTFGIISGVFSDGSVQAYRALCAPDGVTWTINAPYAPTENPLISASNKYPIVAHTYLNNLSASIRSPSFGTSPNLGQVAIYQTSITSIAVGGAPSVFAALANTVQHVRFNIGANLGVAYGVVAFNATGTPVEVALYDGVNGYVVAGVPALYNPDNFDVGSTYLGPWGTNYVIAAPTTTFVMRDDLNTPGASPYPATTNVGTDRPSVLGQIQQVNFDLLTSPEMCVHRWDVFNASSGTILALSSTSAGLFNSPNGDGPLGYASPFAENNFFEVYEWNGTFGQNLNSYTGTSTQSLWTALGGPWRLIGGVVKLATNRYACLLSPSGDDFQRSAFLVSFGRPDTLASVEQVGKLAIDVISAEDYKYVGNIGLFVESMNMARVAAVPLNCPRFSSLVPFSNEIETLSVGAIRQGQNVSGSEVFALDYSFLARKWRVMRQWGDYTVLNGGIVSAFDGSSCNEATMLLWPQRDLTSIAYDRQALKLYSLNGFSRRDYAYDGIDKPVSGEWPPFLNTITRPWMAYEAGFRLVDGSGYGVMYTRWGGDASKDYQTVYSDPRLLQVSDKSRPNTGSGSQSLTPQHYYGRYQSGSQAFNIRLQVKSPMVYIWAPRATLTNVEPTPGSPVTDATIKANSLYTPLVASGDFLARWCYEAVDGTGRVVRSAPSAASSFSVFSYIEADVKGAPFGALTDIEAGGAIREYRYGFFAPRLELTNRLRTASSDSKRVVLQPYFTAEPFATVFYRAPFSSFMEEYSQSFIVPRNATRGVVPFSGTPAVSGSQLGIVTNNYKCFDGPQGDYNGLLSQPVLYTVGGGLDNVAPPSALCMTVHQNRLVLGGADDATVVWFSKELSPTDAPGFNDALTIQIEDGGPVTGLASMESLLVVFKRGMTFIVPGDMPDDTGGAVNRGYVSNTLGTPVRMPHGIGCIDHRAVVETPVGVFFQSQRTIELLSRDMSITPIGLKLDDTLTSYPEVTAAVHNAKDTEVWFSLRNPTTKAIIFAVYNYTTDVWSKHTVSLDSFQPVTFPMTIMDNIVYFATNWNDPNGMLPLQTVVYKQTDDKFFDVSPSGRRYVSMAWQTAPIALNQVQGYQRMKRIRVFGSPIPTLSTGATQTRDPHGASFTLQTDYATGGPNLGTQSAAWTEAEATAVYASQGREVYEVHVAQQKGQKLTLSYAETAPANVSALTHGYGTAFSNMSFVVGLKTGLDKRITSGAKH